jgi:CBS-domain-containing membrane protein
MAGLRSHGEESLVTAIMQRSLATVDADEMLESVFLKLSHCQYQTLTVLADNRLTGLLTMDNVGEFVRIQTALTSKKPNRVFRTKPLKRNFPRTNSGVLWSYFGRPGLVGRVFEGYTLTRR